MSVAPLEWWMFALIVPRQSPLMSVAPQTSEDIVLFVFSGRGIDAGIPGAETARRTDGEVGQGGTPGDTDVTCDEDVLSFG